MKARKLLKDQISFEKDYKRFLELVVQIDPMSYVGILQLLGVPAAEKVKEHGKEKMRGRAFEDTFSDVVEKFSKLSTRKRTTLLQLLEKYVKEKKEDEKKEKKKKKGGED